MKYLRTVANEATYVPLLVRELARADIVHIFSAAYWSFLLAPLPAMIVARAYRRPIVLNYHSGEGPDHLARSRVARAAIARADHRVVPSAFLAEGFRRHGLDASVVPNLIDLDQFAFRDRRQLRPRILSTRNLGHPYNVACTLRAFRDVQERCPEASLTVVGAGPEAMSLRQLARDLQLRNVRFAGRVEPDAMAAMYDAHDVYLQSPDIDNQPLSVLEALACGLPVVSTDVGGVRGILQQGRLGLLAAPNDHRTLAAHVLHLLAHPEEARVMAASARASLQAYAWSSVRSEWLRVYRAVLPMWAPSMCDANV